MSKIDFAPRNFASEEPAGWHDAPRHRIFGSVRSRRDGTPISGAEIACTDGYAVSKPDTMGSYELNTSLTHVVSVRCRARGWQGTSQWVTVSERADTMADFELDPAVDMIVRLRDRGGRPLLESLTDDDLEAVRILRPVFVDQYVRPGSRLSGNVVGMRASSARAEHTDVWYRATIDSDTIGCCCLVLGDRVVDAVRFTGTTSEIVLVASREDLQANLGSLRLTIVDADTGLVIPNLVVRVSPSAGIARTVKPDSRGTVLIEGLTEGDAKVEITTENEIDLDHSHYPYPSAAIDHPLSIDTVAIRAGALTDLGRKALAHTVSISGSVDASQASGWYPPVFALHEDPIEGVQVTTVQPDALGKFVFSGLKSGYYRVGCHFLPEAQVIFVDARLADVAGVHIVASSADQQQEAALRSR